MKHAAYEILPALNDEQEKALQALSKAFLACKKAGVRIRGQSSNLTAWNGKFWTDEEPGGIRDDGYIPYASVKHHGCYLDSGADDMIQGNLTKAGRKALKELTDE